MMKLTEIADLKWIRTMLLWTSPVWIPSLFLVGWNAVTFVQGEIELRNSWVSHLEEYTQMGTVLGQIQGSLEKIRDKQNEATKRDMTLQGEGRAGDFGNSEAFVMINTESDALIYEGQRRVRVINLSLEHRPERVFAINGTVSDRVANRLITFSKRAADLLQVEGAVKIRLEPVLEE